MPPKFRGDSNDWLDQRDAADGRSGPGRKKKRKTAAAGESEGGFLPTADGNAIVTEIFPNQCRVRLSAGSQELLCSYRRKQLLSSKVPGGDLRERAPVAVGDRVKVSVLG